MLRPFGTFYDYLSRVFCGALVYFSCFWYVVPVKSGNPVRKHPNVGQVMDKINFVILSQQSFRISHAIV
jgi:hypothetical protein